MAQVRHAVDRVKSERRTRLDFRVHAAFRARPAYLEVLPASDLIARPSHLIFRAFNFIARVQKVSLNCAGLVVSLGKEYAEGLFQRTAFIRWHGPVEYGVGLTLVRQHRHPVRRRHRRMLPGPLECLVVLDQAFGGEFLLLFEYLRGCHTRLPLEGNILIVGLVAIVAWLALRDNRSAIVIPGVNPDSPGSVYVVDLLVASLF